MTSRPSTAATILAVLAVVLVTLGAYLLSIGPVFWLAVHGHISADAYGVYVTPASLLIPDDSPQAHLAEWYLSFFGPVQFS